MWLTSFKAEGDAHKKERERYTMTRQEYSDFRYIRSYKTKGFPLNYGTTLRIPTNRSEDYKIRLHCLYSEWGFHPCSVRVDKPWCDEEVIVYIFGRTWEDRDGRVQSWERLYTDDERRRFDSALHA